MNTSEARKKKLSHALSPKLFGSLKREVGDCAYAPIVQAVRKDIDLDMEFRGNYLNVYYRGNSILKLEEDGGFEIHENIRKHLNGLLVASDDNEKLTRLITKTHVQGYVDSIPQLKAAVTKQRSDSRDSLEREYEQLIIRANNRESRINSEYVILDRQYAYGLDDSNEKNSEQWDLVAVKWPRKNRGDKNPKGYLALIEVKYDDNPDIKNLASQIEGYHSHLRQNMKSICDDMKEVLNQKLDLDLVCRTERRKDQLRKLTLDESLTSAEIIIYLVDYNPNSTLFKMAKPELEKLPFKIRVAHGGFAMWDQYCKPLDQVAVTK